MYEAVERAVLALKQTVADRRHMILLTDGIPSPGDYREIAGQMAEDGITLSAVTISQGAEQDMLKAMAEIAGGRHKHCDDPADVPKILVQETRTAASAVGEREFKPFALRSLPGLEVASAPSLLGYARTNPKQDAEPLLFAVGGHPLLAWWRYGEGVSMAFMADAKDRWARRWQSWSSYGAFWNRLVQHAARRATEPDLTLDVQVSDGIARLTADLVDQNATRADHSLRANLFGAEGAAQELVMRRVAPDRYQAELPVELSAGYTVEVRSDENAPPQRAAFFVDYPDELRLQPANEQLLRAVATLSGGTYDPDPHEVFLPDGRTVQRLTSLGMFFVLAAMLLFVLDVGIRRLRF
jgi:hypothetical protein